MAAPVIVVPVYGQLHLVERCLRAIDEQTFVSVPVLVIDDCGPQPITEQAVRAALGSGRAFRLIRHEANQGFVATMNHAFAICPASDVVVVNSDVAVLPGWLAALQDALDATAATASTSAVADNGGILSVAALAELRVDAPEVIRQRLEHARAGVSAAVEIPVAVGHCTYFSGRALAEVGGFDPVFSPGYGEEVDWSLRAAQHGWRHVVAMHSYVLHDEGASFGAGSAREQLRRRHELRILARYPRSFVRLRRFARDPSSPLAIELDALARALRTDSARVQAIPAVL
jgi:GT2 family glycosyltransferase